MIPQTAVAALPLVWGYERVCPAWALSDMMRDYWYSAGLDVCVVQFAVVHVQGATLVAVRKLPHSPGYSWICFCMSFPSASCPTAPEGLPHA